MTYTEYFASDKWKHMFNIYISVFAYMNKLGNRSHVISFCASVGSPITSFWVPLCDYIDAMWGSVRSFFVSLAPRTLQLQPFPTADTWEVSVRHVKDHPLALTASLVSMATRTCCRWSRAWNCSYSVHSVSDIDALSLYFLPLCTSYGVVKLLKLHFCVWFLP